MTTAAPTSALAGLPIEALRTELLAALAGGPVVVTAPTGTGKSTQVPRWLPGRTLVVQPRRVAARNVAVRIAELEGQTLGQEVGYRVRDEDRSSPSTRILVVTPGIVLSDPELLGRFDTTVVDEIHERRLDTDLILALLLQRQAPLVAMSATVQGERVASYLGGRALSVQARSFPIEVRYADSGDQPPRREHLPARVRRALEQLGPLSGDVLVFVPGKAEIDATLTELRGLCPPGQRVDLRGLHGGLPLPEQAQVLQGGAPDPTTRRVIVTTNVAETSLTVPGVRVVIDSGLVRRTSYHEGRSFLGLSPIATDSAEQRAGRAGRTAPGIAVRLWSPAFRLEPATPPEIQRENLAPLLLAVAQLGLTPQSLRFLDAPREFALEDAAQELAGLGAIDSAGRLTAVGRELGRLPLDPWLARVLLAARDQGCLAAAIDLVAALEHPKGTQLSSATPDEELERVDCDLVALIHAVRNPKTLPGPARAIAEDARLGRRRLRGMFSLPATPPQEDPPVDRDALLRAIVQADPRSACVARRRKTQLAFSSGGSELSLERGTRAQRAADRPGDSRAGLDAVVVLATRATARGAMKREVWITAASPIPLLFLARAGLGEERVTSTSLKAGKLSTTVARTWAGRTIAERELEPSGALAREAIVQLFLRGSLHAQQKHEAERRLARRTLAARLAHAPEFPFFAGCQPPPRLEDWLLAHLQELGVEQPGDLELLSAEDFLPEDVPAELAPTLNDRFPSEVDVGDCVYSAEYDLQKRQVLLTTVRGGRTTPPPVQYLPRFEGLKVYAQVAGSFHLVRRG